MPEDRADLSAETPRGEFIEWLKEQMEDARAEYKKGPRSENPRQTDINLGRFRAFRKAYRESLKRRSEGDDGE